MIEVEKSIATVLTMCTVQATASTPRRGVRQAGWASAKTVSSPEQDGWITETGRTAGHVDVTATTYELVADAALYVADLGGTKVRCHYES
jgi:hypothetical protein